MTEGEDRDRGVRRPECFEVLIAGGGVAGLEAAFALRELAGERVKVTLVTPGDEFVYRPLSIGEPFTRSYASRYPLARLVADAGANLVRDTLVNVDPERHLARTAGGLELTYDALLVAAGAALEPAFDHATNVDDARIDALLHGLVQDVEQGYVRRLAIVVPAPLPWPLPAYELALMTSERAWDMQVEMEITVLTPERAPLDMFGDEVSRQLAALLDERRVTLVTSAYCEIPQSRTVIVHPGGRSLEADRIVALPRLRGPELSGLPHDGGGFLPIDEYGQVRGIERVWAAGDAANLPIKQGGVAAQLADTAARSIAQVAGVQVDVRPFVPVLEGVLMTGGTQRYLRGRPAWPGSGGESVFTEVFKGSSPPKIASRYLGAHLQNVAGLTVETSV